MGRRIRLIIISIVFLLINILVFGSIYYISQQLRDTRVLNIDAQSKSTSISFLEEDVSALRVNSKAFIIYDPESRVVIAGNNENLRFAPASSAKIMTAIISIEEYNLNKILPATGVSFVVGSKMNLYEGELMTVENLLYGLMLPSGNDAAHVLADNYHGGYLSFINRMNEKARELGLVNTYFVDPAGLEDDNYSSAFDLARLADYAMEDDKFAEIVATKEKTVTDNSGIAVHNLKNLNELLVLPEVIGVKTGFTEQAGGVLVTAVKNEDKVYIIVVLNTPDRFGDTREILTSAIRNIKTIDY